jgi:hypothetical protein
VSYDIIKAPGGKIQIAFGIKAETKEARPDDPRLNDSVGQAVGRGEFATFMIIFPF